MKYLNRTNNQKRKPFFSVITVVKNDEKNILKTIQSINHQIYKNYEYIIIEGKSKDETLNKICKFKTKINLIISENDNGIYDAMNKGIKNSRGDVIVFVNSGDTITNNALEIINKKFVNKKIDFVFGTVLRNYTTSKILKYGFNFKRMLYNFDFATSHTTGFYLKKKVYKKIGLYDTKFKISADYDLYFRLYKNNSRGDYTNKNQLIGIVTPGGYSSKIGFFFHMIEEAKIRIKNGQNFFLIILIFINALIKKFFKVLQ